MPAATVTAAIPELETHWQAALVASLLSPTPETRHAQMNALPKAMAQSIQRLALNSATSQQQLTCLMTLAPQLRHLSQPEKESLGDLLYQVVMHDGKIEPYELAAYQIATQLMDGSHQRRPSHQDIQTASHRLLNGLRGGGQTGLDFSKALSVLRSADPTTREQLIQKATRIIGKTINDPNIRSATQMAIQISLGQPAKFVARSNGAGNSSD